MVRTAADLADREPLPFQSVDIHAALSERMRNKAFLFDGATQVRNFSERRHQVAGLLCLLSALLPTEHPIRD
jgi:hypothetical protein